MAYMPENDTHEALHLSGMSAEEMQRVCPFLGSMALEQAQLLVDITKSLEVGSIEDSRQSTDSPVDDAKDRLASRDQQPMQSLLSRKEEVDLVPADVLADHDNSTNEMPIFSHSDNLINDPPAVVFADRVLNDVLSAGEPVADYIAGPAEDGRDDTAATQQVDEATLRHEVLLPIIKPDQSTDWSDDRAEPLSRQTNASQSSAILEVEYSPVFSDRLLPVVTDTLDATELASGGVEIDQVTGDTEESTIVSVIDIASPEHKLDDESLAGRAVNELIDTESTDSIREELLQQVLLILDIDPSETSDASVLLINNDDLEPAANPEARPVQSTFNLLQGYVDQLALAELALEKEAEELLDDIVQQSQAIQEKLLTSNASIDKLDESLIIPERDSLSSLVKELLLMQYDEVSDSDVDKIVELIMLDLINKISLKVDNQVDEELDLGLSEDDGTHEYKSGQASHSAGAGLISIRRDLQLVMARVALARNISWLHPEVSST